MNQSTPTIQYLAAPPDVPAFLSGRASNLRSLIQWSKDEHQRWLIYCSNKGYFKGLKVLNEEYSPLRFLAEMPKFRSVCANISEADWNALTSRERAYIRKALQLRDQLFRE
jgi:hypothetical protein